MSELLEAALEYRRRGFSPIPLRPGEKEFPAVKWKEMQEEPWTEEQIRDYWTANPDANIGLHPAEQNFLAIDVDGYKGAQVQQDFAQLCMEYNIDYKDAPTVRSPRGGTHIYLGLTEKVAGNRDILGIKYIDTRSYGNFILAPPSRNKEGKRYQWVEGKSIFDNPILPPAPKRFVTALQNDSRRLVDSKAGEVIELNAEFKQTDGREALMASIVYWIGMQFARETGHTPTIPEWIQLAWPEYEAQVAAREGKSLDDDDRGVDMMMAKILSTQRKINRMLDNGEPLDDPNWEKEGMMPIEPMADQYPGITASGYQLTGGASIPPREWIYANHYIRKFLSATISPGGIGKSQLAIVEALSMATGKDLLRKNEPLLDRYRVWYFNAEDPIEEIARRVEATAMHYGITQEHIEDRLLLDSGRDQRLLMAQEIKGQVMRVDTVYDSVLREIDSKKIDAMIIDPFIHTHSVSENANEAVGEVVDMWKAIAQDANCAIEMIHHTRKLNGVDATAEDSRGASSLINAARSVRALSRVPKDAAERAGIEAEEIRRFFYYGPGDKANLAPPPADTNTWRKLVSVDLGNATLEYPDGDNIGVVTAFEPPDEFDGITTYHLQQVQIAMSKGDDRVRKAAQSDLWFGYLVAECCDLKTDTKVQRSRVARIIKIWVQNGAVVESEIKTPQRKMVAAYEVGERA